MPMTVSPQAVRTVLASHSLIMGHADSPATYQSLGLDEALSAQR
jgi:hypothetical protein